jgi:hypothetical protein|tara:strand:- start:3026 stop:3280 length:255 start_codon:yes stop_codon:yes gene_type:complete
MSKLAHMLRTSAEADKAKALLTLELLENHPAGIGDHSTKDFYSNAEEALQMLVDADDRLGAIQKYLSPQNVGLVNGNGYTTTTT